MLTSSSSLSSSFSPLFLVLVPSTIQSKRLAKRTNYRFPLESPGNNVEEKEEKEEPSGDKESRKRRCRPPFDCTTPILDRRRRPNAGHPIRRMASDGSPRGSVCARANSRSAVSRTTACFDANRPFPSPPLLSPPRSFSNPTANPKARSFLHNFVFPFFFYRLTLSTRVL